MASTDSNSSDNTAPPPEIPIAAKLAISAGAVVLILLRWKDKDFTLDATTLGVFGLGCLPWIISAIRTAKLPGGIELTMQSLVTEVSKQKQVVTDNARKIQSQQEIINQLVKYSMSASIYRPLWHIHHGKEYIYHDNETNRREMYFLRDAGYIRPRTGDFLVFDGTIDGRDLSQIAGVTPIGKICVELRGDP